MEFFESSFASWMSHCHVDYAERVQPDPDASEIAILEVKGVEHGHAVFKRLCQNLPQQGVRGLLSSLWCTGL